MNCILMQRCKIIEKSDMWIIKNDISILDQKRPELTVMWNSWRCSDVHWERAGLEISPPPQVEQS